MAEERRRALPPVPGFPELADVAATWAPLPGPGGVGEMRHAAGSWRPTLACDNPTCRGGGFDLASVVEGMISYRETEKAGVLVCSGWEGAAPAAPGEGTPCVRAIRYRVSLVYRAASPAPPPGPSGAPAAAPGGPPDEGD